MYMHVGAHRFPGVGVTDSCELPNVGAKKRTQIVYKDSKFC